VICYQGFAHWSNFWKFEVIVVLGWGGAWSMCKVTIVEDIKVKYCNLSVNVVSDRYISDDLGRNTRWPVIKFLHSEVILEILSFMLFLGGVVHEVCVKWPQWRTPRKSSLISVLMYLIIVNCDLCRNKWWPAINFLNKFLTFWAYNCCSVGWCMRCVWSDPSGRHQGEFLLYHCYRCTIITVDQSNL